MTCHFFFFFLVHIRAVRIELCLAVKISSVKLSSDLFSPVLKSAESQVLKQSLGMAPKTFLFIPKITERLRSKV